MQAVDRHISNCLLPCWFRRQLDQWRHSLTRHLVVHLLLLLLLLLLVVVVVVAALLLGGHWCCMPSCAGDTTSC
jgi:hypothetical protein